MRPPAISLEQTPALAPTLALPMTATSAAPASPRPAVGPVTVQPPLPVASNGVVPLVGITSAPVTLSTQILRASAPSLSLSSSNTPSAWESRGATNYLEAQIALAGLGFSSGSIDGVGGAQTAAALKAFQLQQGLEQTGWLDRNTRKVLILRRPPVVSYRVSADDLLRLAPVPETWVGKSQVVGLEHETLLERLAERFQAHPGFLRRLNSAVDWAQPTEGLELTLPAIPPVPARRAGLIRINLAGRFLRVFDTGGELMAHFPCSIARRVEKRPVGDLQVSVTVPNPDYTWDPEVFPESPESRTVGRKLRIPPGPNNPVGVAWIGLNRSGYGIHGTPKPEDVGRTESHGCFRLANWNAELLRRMAWPGLTVRVEGEVPGTTSTALTASATAVTNAVKASLPSGVPANAAASASSASPAITNSVSPPPL
jgi:lipoprotein-anchoring transpeptidase ErfK/SrfK